MASTADGRQSDEICHIHCVERIRIDAKLPLPKTGLLAGRPENSMSDELAQALYTSGEAQDVEREQPTQTSVDCAPMNTALH